ncbi:HupE/UreJ family protein [Actinoplanes sp. CA-142083]|uniref:HupE/UreJ family protein n=1 Tax=Actinoplanes sp. CA-142083 TaxID=3239903 RepID=UPI003D926451
MRAPHAIAATLTAAAALGAAAPAQAHGVRAKGDESVLDFLGLGFTHMLTGWDHLLFIAAVVLLAWHPRRAAGLLSLFALGHSATLIAATLAGWRLSPALVDLIIAVSVGFVGVVGVKGRPRSFRWFGAAVLAFGLVHGLGLATRFQALSIPPGGLLSRLLAFNLGVELGQILCLYLLYLFGEVLVSTRRWPSIEPKLFTALYLVSFVLMLAAGR